METNKNTEDIFSTNTHLISKKRCAKGVYSALLIFIAGIALFIAAILLIADKTSAAYMGLIVCGLCLAAVGLLKLFFGSKRLFYLPTGSPITKKTLFYKQSDLRPLIQAIESNDFKALSKLEQVEGQGVRIDMMTSKDNKFATCQVFEYIPYTYSPASPVYVIPEEHCENFIAAIR